MKQALIVGPVDIGPGKTETISVRAEHDLGIYRLINLGEDTGLFLTSLRVAGEDVWHPKCVPVRLSTWEAEVLENELTFPRVHKGDTFEFVVVNLDATYPRRFMIALRCETILEREQAAKDAAAEVTS